MTREAKQVVVVVVLLMILRHFDDINFTDGTLLEINKPFFHAGNVENVITNGDLNQLFVFFEKLQTKSALLLLNHER